MSKHLSLAPRAVSHPSIAQIIELSFASNFLSPYTLINNKHSTITTLLECLNKFLSLDLELDENQSF